MCCYGPQILQRKDFTPYDRSQSVTVAVPSKKPDQVVNAMMKYWIAVYGKVKKNLTDNGGEFINEELMTLCKAFNVKVHTSGAESPWLN